MPITLGVPRETQPGEARVALVPELALKFANLGAKILVEHGAGLAAQFPDDLYKNVEFADAATVYARSDVLLKVQPLTVAEAGALKQGAVHLGAVAHACSPGCRRRRAATSTRASTEDRPSAAPQPQPFFSVAVTVKVHDAELPERSSEVAVTWVAPMGKRLPLA